MQEQEEDTQSDESVHCPACGNVTTTEDIQTNDEGQKRCSSCDGSILIAESELREIFETIDRTASSHEADYAAGMRNARHTLEKRLIN